MMLGFFIHHKNKTFQMYSSISIHTASIDIAVEEKRPKTKIVYSCGVLEIKPVRIGEPIVVDHRVKSKKPNKFKGSSRMMIVGKRK